MDKEIETYEFEWWGALIGLILAIPCLIILMGLIYFRLHIYSRPEIQILNTIFYPIIMVPFSFLMIYLIIGVVVVLFFKSKMTIFRQYSITIIYAIKKDRTYTYEDISRLIIGNRSRFSYKTFTRLYFSDKTMIIINPDQMPNFQNVLETIRNKGLGRVVEQN